MGAAGIPVLGYNWIPDGVWRTSRAAPGRGGAIVTGYDHADGARVQTGNMPARSEAEMWENFAYFIRAVLPVAEQAGVRLALHPDDPPVDVLDGVARIMRSPAAFRRALEIGDSPAHGLNLCLGTCAEMGGDAVMQCIRDFGPSGKIVYVHLRNVQGSLPRFHEAFIDEPGFDPVAALRLLRDVGFDGFIIDDHVPHMVNDTLWGHRSRAYNTGVIRGICLALEAAP
jgi:mannonate dehydratase